MDNNKYSFFERHILTFFWLIFFATSLLGNGFSIIEVSKNKKQFEAEMSKYTETVLTFDHVEESQESDGKKMIVYNYYVDDEKYTYKEELTGSESQIKKECRCYYDENKPQEIIKENNDKDEISIIISSGMTLLFLVMVLLSIFGEKIGGGELAFILSFIPLDLLFIAFSVSMLGGAIYAGITGGEPVAIVVLGIMGGVFTPVTIYSEYKLIHMSIEAFKNKKSRP